MSNASHCTPALVFGAAIAVLGAAGAFATPGDWTTFMDGTFQNGIAAEDGTRAGGPARVWVASSGGVTAFTPGDSTTRRLFRNDGLPAQDLTAVAVDASGNRWFGSRARGLQVQTPAGTFLARALDQFDIGSDSVRALLPIGDEVWVGTASGAALVTYPPHPDSLSAAVRLNFNIKAFLGQSPLVSGIAVRADTAWFGTQRGIVRREPDGTRSVVNTGLRKLDVRALALFDGFLWAAVADSVYRFEDGRWVKRSDGLPGGRTVLCFAIFENALHAGLAGGDAPVARLGAGLAWTPRSSSALDGRTVAGLTPLGGRLWAATNRGLHVLGADETWRLIPSVDPPSPGSDTDVIDVSVVPGTREARGVTRVAVIELENGRWAAVPRGQRGLESTALSRILVDRLGRTWVGHCCCGTGSSCRAEMLADLDSTAVAFPCWDILAIAEAPDGRIWLASVKVGDASIGFGLYRITPATRQVEQFTSTTDRLASSSIQALAFDARGQLWIGHTGEGVDIWTRPGDHGAPILHIDQTDGLPSDGVTAIALDGDEAWIGTTGGLAVFAGTQLVRSIPLSALPDLQIHDLAVDGCGRVWVATEGGVVELDRDGNVLALLDDQATPGVVDERVNGIAVEPATASIWFAARSGFSRFDYDPACPAPGAGTTIPACTRFCPFPNPFDPGRDEVLKLTDLAGQSGTVTVAVFDAAGGEVRAARPVGAGGSAWDGRDGDGDPAPSGVYLLKLEGRTASGRPLEYGGAPVFRRVAVRR